MTSGTTPSDSMPRSIWSRLGRHTHRRRHAALVGALALVPAALYLLFMFEPLFGDEAVYATIGRGLLHGQLPYRDLFDNKPPILYGWFTISFLLFGEEPFAPRILAALSLSGTALLVYAAARALLSPRLAYGALAAFGGCTALAVYTANATSEIFMVLPMTGSFLAFVLAIRGSSRRWLIVAGLLAGFAIMTKPVAVWNAGALAAYAVVWGWREHRNLWPRIAPFSLFVAGTLFASALTLVPVAVSGTLGDFFDATVTFPIEYRSEGTESERMQRLAVGMFARFPLFAGPLVLAATTGFVLLLRRRSSPADGLLLVWTVGSIVGMASPGLFFPHYFVQLFPAMALLIPIAVASGTLFPRVSRRPTFNVLIVAVWGVAIAFAVALNGPAFTTLDTSEQHIERGQRGPRVLRENEAKLVAAYISERTTPDDTIYIHGPEASIYFYSDRRPAVRYFYSTPIRVRRDRGGFDELVTSLREQRPRYIVDAFVPTDDDELMLSMVADGNIDFHPPMFRALLEEHYEFVGHLIFVDLYRLLE